MKSVRIIKYVLLVLTSLIAISAAGIVLIYRYYPRESVLVLLNAKAEEALKCRVRIEGLDYSLRGIVLIGVTIYDPEGHCGEVLASAESMSLRFSLIRLAAYRRFDLNHISAEKLFLNVCFKDGASNLMRIASNMKSDETSSITTTIETVSIEKARISLKNPPGALKPLEGEYGIDASIEFLEKNRIRIGDCAIVLPEKRGVVKPSVTLAIDKGEFEITGETALEQCSLLWVYTWGKNLTLPFQSVTGKVTGLKITAHEVEGALKGTSLLASGKPLGVNGSCRVSIDGETVSLANVEGRLLSSSVLVKDFLFNFAGAVMRFRVSGIDVQLAELPHALKQVPAELFGAVRGEVSFDQGRFSGALDLDAGFDQQRQIIRDFKCRLTVLNNIIERTPATLLLYGQPAEIAFSSNDGNFKKVNLNANMREFTYPQAGQDASGVRPGSAGGESVPVNLPFELFGRVSADLVQVDKIALTKCSLDYIFTAGKLVADNVSAQVLGGEVKGKGGVDLSMDRPYIHFNFGFSNVKTQNLGKLTESFRDRVFGPASGSVDLAFSLQPGAHILDALMGKIEFTVDKGKLVNTGIQNGLGVWLEELKYKLTDLEFNKVYGNFNITGKSYQINSFLFSSQDVRIKMDGSFTRDLDGDMRIDLEFTTMFIQDLPNPAALALLSKYKRDRWYVIPFQVKGNIAEPKNYRRMY